jgi:hypothetical protein
VLSKLRDKRVDEGRYWWRYWSARIQALALLIQGAMIVDPVSLLGGMNMMPPHVRNMLPEGAVKAVMVVLFTLTILSILARNVRQPKLEKRREQG